MLRAFVLKTLAIEFSESPLTTTWVTNVGPGVGVGGTKDGTGVGPLGRGLAVGEPRGGADVEAFGPTASGRQAAATSVSRSETAMNWRDRSIMRPKSDDDRAAVVTDP